MGVRRRPQLRIQVAFAVAVGLAAHVFAGDIQFDQKAADKAASFRKVELQTRVCMHEAVRAQLQLGIRDSGQIIVFAIQTCGTQITGFLKDGWDAKMPHPTNEAIVERLYDMALKELRAVPGLSISIPPSNGAQ